MYLSIQISVCLSGRQSGRQTDTQTDRHAHACTHPSINLPVRLYISLQYLLYSIPCHAMLPVFCAAHVISSHFILSCLASFYLTHHFISSIFFLSLHLYIAWHYILLFDARCLHMYIIYIYNMPLQRSFSWKSSHCTRCHFSTEHSAWEQRDITWHPSSWQHKAMKGTWLWQWMRIDRIL